MNLIKLSEPELNGDVLEDFNRALLNKEVGYAGMFVDCFRQQIGDYLGTPHVGLYTSGTASIHLALRLAGVGKDDEVICQSLTFAASANPICYLGANPVFVGSEAATWNMCPKHLEQALTDRIRKGKKVKAIIPVHLYGMPAQMKEIMEIAANYNIPVIEDAAEALGSRTVDGKCGTLGDYGVLSFNANKIITSGGGGSLIAKEKYAIEKADFWALQAKDPAPHYQHSQIGYNYAFSNLNAVLGNAQFKQLDEKIGKRKRNFEHYLERLSIIDKIHFQNGIPLHESNRWLTSIVLPDAEHNRNLKSYLESRNIETRPIWKPMHTQPLYKDFPYYGNKSEEGLFQRGMCLPSGSGLSDENLDYVCDSIVGFF